jgi:hypothetical protein
MHALDRLLHLVAQQDEVPGAQAHGDQVGQGHLPRLIHEEIVQSLVQGRVGEQPGGAGQQLGLRGDDGLLVPLIANQPATEMAVGVVGVGLLQAGEDDALLRSPVPRPPSEDC